MKKYKIKKIEDKQLQKQLLKRIDLWDTCEIYNFRELCNIDYMSATIFHNSNLHKILNTLFQKQNLFVQGKYKRARLYFFEFYGQYFYALTETGNKGSCFGFFVDPEYDRNILTYSKKILENKKIKLFCRKIYKLLVEHKDLLK